MCAGSSVDELTAAAFQRPGRTTLAERERASLAIASTLGDLVAEHGELILPLQLDVDDREADFAAVAAAAEHFGGLDGVSRCGAA